MPNKSESNNTASISHCRAKIDVRRDKHLNRPASQINQTAAFEFK